MNVTGLKGIRPSGSQTIGECRFHNSLYNLGPAFVNPVESAVVTRPVLLTPEILKAH